MKVKKGGLIFEEERGDELSVYFRDDGIVFELEGYEFFIDDPNLFIETLKGYLKGGSN